MSEGLRTLESPRSPRGGQHRRDEAACLAQRVWRGVRARRTFSELFFASVEASLSGSSVPINMFIAGDEEASEEAPSSRCCEEADTTGAVTTSLQEAQTEASYKYNHHILSSAAGSSEPPIGSGPTPSREPPPSVSRWVSVAGVAATPPPMRWASSAGLDVALSPARAGGEDGHAAPAIGVHHRRTASRGMPRSLHRRGSSEGGGGSGTHTVSSLAAAAAEDDSTPGLEFTAEMAEGMSMEALREMATVLARIITTRNKELVSLVERQDELRHERDFRQATVSALVAQVDKSQWVKNDEARSRRKPERR